MIKKTEKGTVGKWEVTRLGNGWAVSRHYGFFAVTHEGSCVGQIDQVTTRGLAYNVWVIELLERPGHLRLTWRYLGRVDTWDEAISTVRENWLAVPKEQLVEAALDGIMEW